jgi:hypothetical protein
VDFTLTESADDLTLTAQFDRMKVSPGDQVAIDVTVRNDRNREVEYAVDTCGAAATMSGALPVPLVPDGREWSGISGEFKKYVLTSGLGPGGVPATDPVTVLASSRPCVESPEVLSKLAAADSVATTLEWSAEIVPGVPTRPADIPFVITFAYDPAAPPSYPPDYTGIRPSWVRSFKQLQVGGVISVEGAQPAVVSMGEAVDALLADTRFADWLADQPPDTWSVANIHLVNVGDAQGIIPSGPVWQIELFREVDVPRNWAIGFVDPFSSEVRSLTICEDPCSR